MEHRVQTVFSNLSVFLRDIRALYSLHALSTLPSSSPSSPRCGVTSVSMTFYSSFMDPQQLHNPLYLPPSTSSSSSTSSVLHFTPPIPTLTVPPLPTPRAVIPWLCYFLSRHPASASSAARLSSSVLAGTASGVGGVSSKAGEPTDDTSTSAHVLSLSRLISAEGADFSGYTSLSFTDGWLPNISLASASTMLHLRSLSLSSNVLSFVPTSLGTLLSPFRSVLR